MPAGCWDYDAGGARFRRVDDGSGQAACTTLYLGNVERKTCGATVTWRRMLAGVAMMELAGSTAGVVNHTRSLLHDHLGSVVAAVDLHSGGLVERGDYGAFGSMRTALDGVAVGVAALATTTRGFTGQEQLGSLDVIHMNGRIYDPQLGRFLQADPLVAQPANPQNWNPYAYVFNNPLANTDPTGMFSVRQALGMIIAIVGTVFAPEGAGLWYAMFVGAISGAVSTGSIKGAVVGAFSAALFYGIGTQFQSMSDANVATNANASVTGEGEGDTISNTGLTAGEFGAKVLEHGIAGGVMSVLQGGKFGNGFVSAGFSEAVSPVVGEVGDKVEQGVAASLVGGTASALSGGKFADGAASAAFGFAFNETMHEAKKTLTEHVARNAMQVAIDISNGKSYPALDENGDGKTYCAELLKHPMFFGAAPTWEWRAGRPIVPGMDIQPGTAIATFDEKTGRYPKGDAKHAAIFIGFDPDGKGILVLDQYMPGKNINYRLLPWHYVGTNSHTDYVNSASSFSTIKW